ncbi:MAG: hypothetical protein KatS3mg078_0362 [Deltaproteobacteria bacterium]|nr:MAG: hypothetical protein KatS3mg078_0362 [Deltaproteobacteria bacterium]
MRYLHNLSLEKTIFFLLILLSFSLSVNALIQATKWVNRPFPGFLVYNSLIVSQVTLPRWSLSRELGIRSYDKILKVDGHPVSSAYELYDLVDDTPVGTPRSYLVLRDGKLYELSIPTMKFTFDDLLQIFGIEFTIGLIFLISGVVVYVLKPQLTVSKIFLLMCISIGVWFIEDFNYQTTYSPFYSLNIAYLAQIFAPTFTIILSWIFPTDRAFFRKRPYIMLFPLIFSAGSLYFAVGSFGFPIYVEKGRYSCLGVCVTGRYSCATFCSHRLLSSQRCVGEAKGSNYFAWLVSGFFHSRLACVS